MKFLLLSFFVLFLTCLNSNAQNPILDQGDACFKLGDYNCAIVNYEKLLKNKSSQIIKDRLDVTRKCNELLNRANDYFSKKKYFEAKIEYKEVLKLNPNDTYAKQQIEKCNSSTSSSAGTTTSSSHTSVSGSITLTVSRSNLSFSALGGTDNINIFTNANSYTVELLPSWCKVQKCSNYFVITCDSNPTSNFRCDYFIVKAGNNTERVYIYQVANKPSQNSVSTTLSLSKSSLSFTASGGYDHISITPSSSTYTIELLPSWCTVQKYTGYFVITCNPNPTITARNDYFTVKTDSKSVQVYLYQAGGQSNKSPDQPTTLSVSQQSIYFDSKGGNSSSITVYSNAKTYSVSMMPSWCTIKYYSGYFVVICSPNNSSTRSDWFYVNAGDKQVKITVKQDGRATNKKRTNLYLGASALKPLVFMSDGKTLTNMNVGYGFTLGVVKTLGVYAKLNTNFSEIKGDYSNSNFPTDSYVLDNNPQVYKFNRFGLVGGLMLQLEPLIIYAGAGKGHFYHFKEVDTYRYLDDSFKGRVNLTTMSYSGVETDAGLIINFNKIGISLGISSFAFKYYEVNAGLGIRL